MIEQTFNSGEMTREFVLGKNLGPKVLAAIRNPKTKKVEAVRVGRNEQCSCGSGRKFKKCCIGKVGCGAEIVS